MLIGIDASRAATGQRTGTENYALYLIRALLDRDGANDYRLYFNRAPGGGLFRQGGRVVWRVMPFPRLWTHVRLAWETAVHPPDVLFVPSHVVPLLHPRRCVVTVHDLGYLYYPQTHRPWARWYLNWSTRFSARVARRVIADSEATRRDLMHWYGVDGAKITVAYPAGAEGFAPVREHEVLRAVQQRYGTGASYYLYLGRLHPRKNLETCVRAFAALLQEHPDMGHSRLVLAGKPDGRAQEILRTIASTGLGERVVLPGYVPREDLPALLSGALAYVLPSWYEGFGLPLLEAMACETPVICSNVSSLPEIAGDAALLVDPGDHLALTRAMECVYRDEGLRRALIARGRERVQVFSWERCADIVGAVLREVAAEA